MACRPVAGWGRESHGKEADRPHHLLAPHGRADGFLFLHQERRQVQGEPTMMRERGFTLVEAIMGMVIAGMILAACYAVWRTHAIQGASLSKKIDLRNKLTLSSKR